MFVIGIDPRLLKQSSAGKECNPFGQWSLLVDRLSFIYGIHVENSRMSLRVSPLRSNSSPCSALHAVYLFFLLFFHVPSARVFALLTVLSAYGRASPLTTDTASLDLVCFSMRLIGSAKCVSLCM